MSNRETVRAQFLRGTLDLMILQSLAAMGPMHGYAIAARLEQASAGALLPNMGTLYLASCVSSSAGSFVRNGTRRRTTAKRASTDHSRGAPPARFREDVVGPNGGDHAEAVRHADVSSSRRGSRRCASRCAARRARSAAIRASRSSRASSRCISRWRRRRCAAGATRPKRRRAWHGCASTRCRERLNALHEQRGLPWLGRFSLDVKLGVRRLRKSWGLTVIGGLAMTTAIAIAAGGFSFVRALSGGALPLDEGDRVVAIQTWSEAQGRSHNTTPEDFERWRGELRSVEGVGAFERCGVASHSTATRRWRNPSRTS